MSAGEINEPTEDEMRGWIADQDSDCASAHKDPGAGSGSDASTCSDLAGRFPENPHDGQTIAISWRKIPDGRLSEIDAPEGWVWAAISNRHVRFMYCQDDQIQPRHD